MYKVSMRADIQGADKAQDAVVALYQEVLDWYKGIYPRRRASSYPIFDVTVEDQCRYDHREKDFRRYIGLKHFSIFVNLNTDADDIAFRFRFAQNGLASPEIIALQ